MVIWPKSQILYPLSLFSPSLSLSSLSLLRAIWGRATLRLPRDGPATTGRADLRRGYLRVRLRVAVTT